MSDSYTFVMLSRSVNVRPPWLNVVMRESEVNMFKVIDQFDNVLAVYDDFDVAEMDAQAIYNDLLEQYEADLIADEPVISVVEA